MHQDNREPEDRNFDDIAEKFCKRIYASEKGQFRIAILERDIDEVLERVFPQQHLQILDAGGGAGQFSSRLAAEGHTVTLCDISEKMLEIAAQQFARQAPKAKPRFIHSSIQSLHKHDCGTYDLVLFHAVLEWLHKPEETLFELLNYVKPGGIISVLFYNHHGLVLRNLLRGGLDKVRRKKLAGWGDSLTPINPIKPEKVMQWFSGWGYQLHTHSGVRCFSDFMQREVKDHCDPELRQAMELELCREEPYRSIARYVHVTWQKTID